MNNLDHTHDKTATSWVEMPQGRIDFPIQNLPYGVCSHHGIVVAIGNQALNIQSAIEAGAIEVSGDVACALSSETLNDLMNCGKEAWKNARHAIFALLSSESKPRPSLLLSMDSLDLIMPASIGDYTDFYAA